MIKDNWSNGNGCGESAWRPEQLLVAFFMILCQTRGIFLYLKPFSAALDEVLLPEVVEIIASTIAKVYARSEAATPSIMEFEPEMQAPPTHAHGL